jgi:hypothetical protein
MLYDHVVAVVDDAHLSTILPVIHRNGLGHVARALRANRVDVREQLRRAGVPVEQSPAELPDARLLLMIGAAARSPSASELLLQQGAIRVWIVSANGAWQEIDDRIEVMAAVAIPTQTDVAAASVHPIAIPGIVDDAPIQ